MGITKQQLGGQARAKKLSPQRRREIAYTAAIALWTKIRMRSNNRKVVTRNRLTHPVTAD